MRVCRVVVWVVLYTAGMGCSSPDTSGPANNGTSTGGSTSNGGSGNTTGGGTEKGGSASTITGGNTTQGGSSSTAPGGGSGAGDVTAGCPAWPTAKLLPLIGVMFYGPDPGPCSTTQADGSVLKFKYDSSNVLTQAATEDQSLIWKFTHENGLLVGEQDITAKVTTTFTFSYPAGHINYVVRTSGAATPNYTANYTLDARGYPQSATVADESATPSPDWPHRYTYTYDGCKIATRTAYLDSGAVAASLSWNYHYDAAGHLTEMTKFDSTAAMTYDYSCWAN